MVSVPNLPEDKVSIVAASGQYKNIILSLNSLGIDCIEIPCCDKLAKPVASHADMLINHLGNNDILFYNYSDKLNADFYKNGFDLIFSEDMPYSEYPYDIGLNALTLSDIFVCCQRHCNKRLLECNKDKTLVNVRQGYVKCSVCVVNKESVIVSDEGIYRALKSLGINCLLVSKEDILLDGYNYGFIGGCTGLLDKNTLAFTGSLKYHRDGEKIHDFLKNVGVDVIELTNERPVDIGSIIPLR